MTKTHLRRWSAAMLGWILAALAACGGGAGGGGDSGTSGGAGVVVGTVLASRDSSPVAGASVSVAGRTATTAEDGRFRFEGIDAGRAVLRVHAPDHVEGVVPVDVVADGIARVQPRLVREAAATTIDAGAAVTVTVAGSRAALELPADSLVVAGTNALPTGPVTARLTTIDAATDPGSMPGGFFTDGGVPIESFGAMNIALQDASGNRLALRSGRTAVIRVPLTSRNGAPPAEVPLFFLDEATGRWSERGVATLRQDGDDAFFEATVDRLAVWNVDKPLDTVIVRGCLAASGGQPAPGASVFSNGIDYSGTSAASADAEGKFAIAIRRNGRATLEAEGESGVSATTAVGPAAAGTDLSACLVLDHAVPAPVIIEQPRSATTWQGMGAVFNVVASGGRALRYQWRRDGADMPGETSSWLVVAAAAAVDGARYSVVVSNAANSATSEEAVLSVAAVDVNQQQSHLRLVSLLFEFYDAAASAWRLVDDENRFVDPATACDGGSVTATFDGAPLVAGSPLPGSGVLGGKFDACISTDEGDLRSGSSSVSFVTSADRRSFTASATADAMHIRRAAWSADEEPEELLASGSASASWEESTRNGKLTQIGTFVPGRGATLRNERSGATAVFESGGASTTTVTPVSDDALEPPVDWQLTHDNMRFTVGGVPYVSSGTLQMLGIGTGFAGSGEIGLWSGGRRVGRIYMTAEGQLLSEVNGTVLPFDGWKVPRGAAR